MSVLYFCRAILTDSSTVALALEAILPVFNTQFPYLVQHQPTPPDSVTVIHLVCEYIFQLNGQLSC